MNESRIENLEKRNSLEKIILELETMEKSAEVEDKINQLMLEIGNLYRKANRASRAHNDDHKLYLSEIVEKEKPAFGSNNLILAPVGSGKSVMIEKVLLDDYVGNAVMLVSNRYLKEDVCPHNTEMRRNLANDGESEMMFTTRNRRYFGTKNYKVHVLTYSEFGYKIMDNDNFMEDVNMLFCDEIHSLPEYKNIGNDEALICALRYVFQKYKNKQIFYFTATDDNLIELSKERPALLENVTTFDYREHEDIIKYVDLSEYKINHIEQIRPHLKARIKSFNYFKLKGLAFNKRISGQKIIEDILIEEGYKPLVLWSDKNDDYPLSKEQLRCREELIKTGLIPEPYNFLVINSAMREGWDLKDNSVKLAIMNTMNNTDSIQARGRLRGDLDVLIYRTLDEDEDKVLVTVPERYLDNPLTTKIKNTLCKELNITDSRGRQSKWRAVKGHLFKNGYEIFDMTETIQGKRTRVSYITNSN